MNVLKLSVRIVFALLVVAFFALPTFAQVAEMQKKADAGDVKAQLELGFHYDTDGNYEDAMKWYRKAADNGSAAANVGIGFLILNGQGVPQNKEKGKEIIRKSVDGLLNEAKQDEPIAQVIMGWCYDSGNGVTEDKSEAVKWFRKAAEQGNAVAQNNLGDCYYNGNGVTEDKSEAVKWYRKAAEQGNACAQNNIGECYYNGEGVTEDKAEAVKWFRKAAEQGYASAQNNLGDCYYNGEGVTQDYAEAVKWYRKAAEQGYATAQNMLGNCYDRGAGVTKDQAEAVKWYRKAAEQGYATAQHNLGVCYFNGEGVAEDKAEAVKWYRKAAEQGNKYAQNSLGNCYYTGKGFDGYKDYKEAMKWYRKAAEQGYVAAQISLGNCYYKGKGVEKNVEEARKWFKKAGEPENSIEDYKSGMRFLELKEFKSAKEFLKLAADRGHGDAHYQLYKIYDDCDDHKDGLAAQELDKNSDGKEDESGEKFRDLKITHIRKAAEVNHPAGLCYWAVYAEEYGKSESGCRELYIRGQELGFSFTMPNLEKSLDIYIPAKDPEVEAARQKERAEKRAANRCTVCNDKGEIYGLIGNGFLWNGEYGTRKCPVCGGTGQKKPGRRLCGSCNGGGYVMGDPIHYTETEYQGNGRSISHERSVGASSSKCRSCKGAGYHSN
ncbi:hypothetical protein FACS189454_05630 [Planctomycetales bacterium]|nr:hypothetical protein FACS189454_05630 [Planctomycetales bacterium]